MRHLGVRTGMVVLLVLAATLVVPSAPRAMIGGQPDFTHTNVGALVTNIPFIPERLTMPPVVAQLVGVAPEGPITHVRCEGSGTMMLTQSGDTFSGTATQDVHVYATAGGQSFQDPNAAASITVADGVVNGRNIQFSFNGPIVTPCPHRAVISAVENGTAVALSGKGRRSVPGHPQSESPVDLDPPPAGTSVTAGWTATRP